MCGRFASILPADALAAFLRTLNPPPNTRPCWNIAPTMDAPVVRLHPNSGERQLDVLHWGLLPHFVRDRKGAKQPFNARSETVATAPMFRGAFAARRCLVPADAFYEWHREGEAKLPWAVAREDGRPMVFAGLWEGWRGPDEETVRSFTILTAAAPDGFRHIHERIPLILPEAAWGVWLGEAAGDPASWLRPPVVDGLRLWRVGTAVNAVRNDGAALLAPLATT